MNIAMLLVLAVIGFFLFETRKAFRRGFISGRRGAKYTRAGDPRRFWLGIFKLCLTMTVGVIVFTMLAIAANAPR